MEDNKTYFGEIGHGLKTLAVGMKTSWKEYFKDFFTNKSTEQYPENRKTTLHVAKRHRGRLVFKRDENGDYKCTACTLCEKSCPNGTIKILSHMAEDPETGKKKKVLDDYQYDLGDCMFCQLCTNACNLISRTPCSTARSWCSTSTRKSTRVVRCPTSSKVVLSGRSVSLTLKRSNALWVIQLCLSFSRCSSSAQR